MIFLAFFELVPSAFGALIARDHRRERASFRVPSTTAKSRTLSSQRNFLWSELGPIRLQTSRHDHSLAEPDRAPLRNWPSLVHWAQESHSMAVPDPRLRGIHVPFRVFCYSWEIQKSNCRLSDCKPFLLQVNSKWGLSIFFFFFSLLLSPPQQWLTTKMSWKDLFKIFLITPCFTSNANPDRSNWQLEVFIFW